MRKHKKSKLRCPSCGKRKLDARPEEICLWRCRKCGTMFKTVAKLPESQWSVTYHTVLMPAVYDSLVGPLTQQWAAVFGLLAEPEPLTEEDKAAAVDEVERILGELSDEEGE